MTHDERGAWLFGASVMLAYGIYLALVLPRALDGPIAEVSYAPALLVTFGAMILSGIVLGILPSRSTHHSDIVRDARDEEITAHGERVGQGCIALAAIGALVLALGEADPFWIANSIYLGFVLAAILSCLARIAAYRWGMVDA